MVNNKFSVTLIFMIKKFKQFILFLINKGPYLHIYSLNKTQTTLFYYWGTGALFGALTCCFWGTWGTHQGNSKNLLRALEMISRDIF